MNHITLRCQALFDLTHNKKNRPVFMENAEWKLKTEYLNRKRLFQFQMQITVIFSLSHGLTADGYKTVSTRTVSSVRLEH